MLSVKWFVSSPDVDAKSDVEIEGDEEKKEEVIYYLLHRLQSCTGLSFIVISYTPGITKIVPCIVMNSHRCALTQMYNNGAPWG